MSEIKKIYEDIVPARFRVFLDEKGLTMSAANHQANMVKEQMQSIASNLSRTNGFTSTVSVKDKDVKLDNYITIEDLDKEAIKEGVYYGLSAWLREGIQAKEQALEMIKSANISEFTLEDESEAIEIPDMPFLEAIVLEQYTELDAINELTIKERQEYLAVEAAAAHLGKKLHVNASVSTNLRGQRVEASKDGKILEMRNQLNGFRETNLIEYSLGGPTKEVCVVTNSPLYTREYMDKLFLQLQEQHRSYEERLNYYKGILKDKVATKNIELTEEYCKKTSEANRAYKEKKRAWDAIVDASDKQYSEINQGRENMRLQVAKYVAKLKIIIPDALTSISKEIADISSVSDVLKEDK